MPKRRFRVVFKSGDEQTYLAEKVVEDEGYLVFFNPSTAGEELAGLAYLPEIKGGHQIEEAGFT